MVYVAMNGEDFPADDLPTAELSGEDNIVYLKDIDVEVSSGMDYKWRVDCVPSTNAKQYKQRRTGDTWIFTISE